jgi:predicted transglutaminase-like cysteine proteinase
MGISDRSGRSAGARRRLIGLAAGVLLGLTALLVPAAATARPAVPIPEGFLIMCQQHPAECRGGGPSVVPLTDALMATVRQVNGDVNRRMTPRKYEPIDVWSLNVSQGDCEDYVLAKRHALIARGVPASALSIVYALRNGGGHAILAIHTDGGDFALDNVSSTVKPLQSTGYRLVSMSGPDPLVWHRP